MKPDRARTLELPGVSLFIKERGSGPLLLLLQGGDGDADGLNSVADHLVDHFRVVSYDRRGLSRSKMLGAMDPLSLETHADDASCVLASVGSEPALLFGC